MPIRRAPQFSFQRAQKRFPLHQLTLWALESKEIALHLSRDWPRFLHILDAVN
jgi:hypothetical protein